MYVDPDDAARSGTSSLFLLGSKSLERMSDHCPSPGLLFKMFGAGIDIVSDCKGAAPS